MPRALIDGNVNPSSVSYSRFCDRPNRINDDWSASERYQSVAASIFDHEDRFVFGFVCTCEINILLLFFGTVGKVDSTRLTLLEQFL